MISDQYHVVYLTGAPATGKSTLVSYLTQAVEPLEAFTYSKLLADYIGQRQATALRENQLRKQSAQIITPADVDAVDQLLIEQVQEKRSQTHIIIDSHPVTKEAYGYRVTAFPLNKLLAVRPTLICMLYTAPEVVVERIQHNNQGRPHVSLFEAAFHSEMQASVAITYGIQLGVPVYLFDSNKPVGVLAEEIITRLEAQNSQTRRMQKAGEL